MRPCSGYPKRSAMLNPQVRNIFLDILLDLQAQIDTTAYTGNKNAFQ